MIIRMSFKFYKDYKYLHLYGIQFALIHELYEFHHSIFCVCDVLLISAQCELY